VSITIRTGDCRDVLARMPAQSVQCCVTSPPYFGLRDYGNAAQIGLEPTPDAYVAEMVAVFAAVRRVLRDDGTLWLNLGDSYAGSWGAQGRQGASGMMAERSVTGARGRRSISEAQIAAHPQTQTQTGTIRQAGLKPKDLLGIPWLVAFALRADGWYLRQDIIWQKPNPMPESVTDRCTKAHEYVFLLSKSARYYYDQDAIREPLSAVSLQQIAQSKVEVASAETRAKGDHPDRPGGDFALTRKGGASRGGAMNEAGANKRSVWPIATQPYSGAHFATMPPELAETCIKAGSKPGDMILDPFGGAGTTALVADRLQRDATIIELSPTYAALARDRIEAEAGLFARVAAE
jgi:DNA modification methylase